MPNTTGTSVKIVIDTSVIIAALLSSIGGSNKIITSVKNGQISAIISGSTRDEIQRNIGKFRPGIQAEFNNLIRGYFQEIIPHPSLVDAFSKFVDPDDAHLLAVCKMSNADYLVSLNRKHLLGNKQAQSAIKAEIVSPKDLIAALGL